MRSLAQVPDDPIEFKVFRDFGQFSEAEARRVLASGPLPRISVDALPAGTFGRYRSGDRVVLSEVIAHQFERLMTSWGWSRSQSAGERPGSGGARLEGPGPHVREPRLRPGLPLPQGAPARRHRRQVPDLEIEGWIGWDANGRPHDPLRSSTNTSTAPRPPQ